MMGNPKVKIATDIETGIFYSIIDYLKRTGWELSAQYDEKIFDKGIDFDFYEFCKSDEKIRLAWSNWFEGEVEAEMKTLTKIVLHFKFKLKYTEPEYLHKPNFISDMKNLINFKK